MSIHYENYKTFSKGQGYVGVACRTKSAQASTARWFATDCPTCKMTLLGRWVTNGERLGRIEEVRADHVLVRSVDEVLHIVSLKELDAHWGPA